MGGCGVKDEIMLYDDQTYTKDDYIEAINNELVKNDRIALVVNMLAEDVSKEEDVDKLYKQYERSFEDIIGDELTKEEKEALKDTSKRQSGYVQLLLESDLVKEKDIKKSFKGNETEAIANIAYVPNIKGVDNEEIKKSY